MFIDQRLISTLIAVVPADLQVESSNHYYVAVWKVPELSCTDSLSFGFLVPSICSNSFSLETLIALRQLSSFFSLAFSDNKSILIFYSGRTLLFVLYYSSIVFIKLLLLKKKNFRSKSIFPK